MKELRLHGRGGQGVVMGASMLAYAFVLEGKFASSIPMFGFERRGAPVTASVRFNDQLIKDSHLIYEPDCAVILDSSFSKSPVPIEGLKGDGILVVNTPKSLKEHYSGYDQIKMAGCLDATGIALEEINRPISNTCMLGAVAKATGWVTLDAVVSSLEMSFSGEPLKRNAEAARRGYEEIELFTFDRG
ncbi:2-oxoacid:acceptor oxidoreductase family protein [Thermodesulfobacteriota bacterium]